MGFLTSSLFWGIVFILIGIVSIIKYVFHIDIPITRIVVAFFFIFLGLNILTGGRLSLTMREQIKREETHSVFGDVHREMRGHEREYSTIFGKSEIKITAQTLKQYQGPVEINTVFGGTILRIEPGVQVRIDVNSVFAGATMPDGNQIAFGSYSYRSKDFDSSKPYVHIKANVVFGGLQILPG